MEISVATKRVCAVFAATSVLALGAVTEADAAPAPSVTISGKAYRFNHMDTPIPGATIKVRENSALSTVTDANGDYVLTVPNDTNVTPYIESGDYTPGQHYNEIDLQTFHPRGEDIVNANFQTPSDPEYLGLKLILSVESREDGRPAQCAIVTTSSARNVRGVDYQTFWDRTPHGVAGTTAIEFPALDGPIYFNDSVIPDKTKTESSEDGGIVWVEVPAGTYRITGSNPNTRFASFLATCAPGRVVNANPPWGMYELAPGEEPLAASDVAGSVTSAKAVRKGKKARQVKFKATTGEQLDLSATLYKGGKKVGSKSMKAVAAGKREFTLAVKPSAGKGKATLKVKMTDAAGVSFTSSRTVNLPKVVKKHKKN